MALSLAASFGIFSELSGHESALAATPSSWLTAVSGSWTDSTKWSTNPSFPKDSSYDATLSAVGPSYKVTFSSSGSINNITVKSSKATLNQTGGTLTLAGTLNVSSGTFQLSGGAISGGTLQLSGGALNLGGLNIAPPLINGVTLSGMISTNGYLNVTNGITFNSGILNVTGNTNNILFTGSQTISGNGRIVFAGTGFGNTLAPADDASTLVIGAGITTTISAIPTQTTSATVGRATAPLVNYGVITCDNNNDLLVVQGSGFNNQGTINISAGTLILNGTTTTAQLGTINNTGGTLSLSATLDNTAGTLDLASTGPLRLDGGQIRGGTILSTNPSAVLYTGGSSGTLDGVTLDVDLLHNPQFGGSNNITVKNGLMLQNHNIVLNSGSGIVAADSSTFGGTGQIIVSNLSNSSGYVSLIGGTNVTIGPNVMITSGTGSSIDDSISVTTVLNQGTISLGATATPMKITNTIPWTNAGTISVASNTLSVKGSWTNSGVMIATGGTLSLAGNWSNPGAITATNAAVVVAGTGTGWNNISVTNGGVIFADNYTTAQTRAINRSGSYIGIGLGSVIDNTGDTINADGAAPIYLLGGTLRGGTVSSTNGGQIIASLNFPVLDTVTLNAPLSGGYVTANNVTNNSSITISSAALTLGGSWSNNGSISTTKSSVNFNSMPASPGNFSISGGFEYLFASATTAQLQQISCSHASWTLINGATINNTGNNLVLSQNGSNWSLYGGEVDGGSITSTDGTPLVLSRSSSYSFTSLIMDAVTLGTGAQIGGEATLTIRNGLTLANNAVVQVGVSPTGTATVVFSGTQMLTGTGTILLNGDRGNLSGFYTSSGVLTIDNNIAVATGSSESHLGNATVGNIINNGLISSPTSTGTLTIAGNFTNGGTIEARNGGTVIFATPGLVTNLQSGNLVGGTWNVYAGSTIDFPSTSILGNGASITLSGPGSNFAALNTLASNTGSLTLIGGRIFATSAPVLTNDGVLSISSGSELDASVLHEQSDGTLSIELSKGSVSSGRLIASASATLAGTLQLSLAQGYTPAAGDSLSVLTGASVSGTFSNIVMPALPIGIGYTIVYSPTDVEVDFITVPEPAALSLLLGSTVLLGATSSAPRRNRSVGSRAIP